MYEISHQGIATVEALEKPRSSQNLEAIYIISPEDDSIRRLCDDYQSSSQTTYSAVHLFFLRPCPQPFLDPIRSCKPLIKVLKSVNEINLDFLVLGKSVFSFDMKDALVSLYSQASVMDQAQSALVEYRKNTCQNLILERMVTLCATLNEYPFIQYKYLT